MKKVHRVLSGAAAVLMLGGAVQALEPAPDPLPDLSAYPTQLLVDGQAVEQGAMPRYFGKTALLPLRSILEQAGYTVAWDAQAEGAAFSRGASGEYLLDIDTGVLTLDGAPVWTDPNAVVLSGTTYVSAELMDYVDGVSASWDGATNTAVVTTDAPRDNVYCYYLGEGTLTQGTREIPYQMQGVIGVPEGENCPVVIFLHGSHPVRSAAENRYDLTRLGWDSADASVTIPVTADLEQAAYLQLDLAQDSGDTRNRRQDQSLTVALRDAAGKEASVEVKAGESALTWQEGTVESIPVSGREDLLQYSTFTPLGTPRLDTAAFSGVDLGEITQVKLTFDQPSGSIMLREIQSVN